MIGLYVRDIVPTLSRPLEAMARTRALLHHFAGKRLSEVTGATCRAFVAASRTPQAARRALEDLRAAINYHHREGLTSDVIAVALPAKAMPRERWLTRSEAAALIWSAWRYREVQKGVETDRRSRRHVARFLLVALYTGTRSGAICNAALGPAAGRAWVDLDRGVFYRRPAGARETKKRQPPAPLPPRLLAHLRRWARLGQRSVVEFNRRPVDSIRKAFAATVRDAGLGPEVTPHICRHTAATWAMQGGADLWDAARYLGMTVETLERVYGHHHPDSLGTAVRAMNRGGRPQEGHRLTGNGSGFALDVTTGKARKAANG